MLPRFRKIPEHLKAVAKINILNVIESNIPPNYDVGLRNVNHQPTASSSTNQPQYSQGGYYSTLAPPRQVNAASPDSFESQDTNSSENTYLDLF